MTDLNELFKVISEGKKQYEETDPVGKQIKQAKEHISEDLGTLFAQLSTLKEDLEKELVVEEAKLTSLIDEESIKRDAQNIVNEVFGSAKKPVKQDIITEEIPAQPVIHTPEVKATQVSNDVDRYLTDKSFQQPEPDLVAKNVEDIRNKIKFLEQAIGRIAAAGPGGGEVNLRWLDDVDRSTITDGWYLRYSEAKKKFEFAEVIGGGGNGATGPAGATGPQGDTGGASGPQGLTGATGPSGVDGASGINGLDGATGPQGIDGASGIQGDQGASGVQGEQGASGINGVDGATGPQGIDGASGADSTVPGATGEVGATGIDGATGPQGIDGATGPQGIDGASGATGTNGIDGATGIQGASGADGTNGVDGSTGPQGEPGATGVDGASGVQGASGVDGTNGIDGATGPQGPDGASGADSTVPGATGLTGATGVGIDGSTGPQGNDGASGIQGDQGASGATGTQGASGIGASGLTGLTGATGATGIQGASGSTGLGATGLTGATGSPGVGGAVGYYGSFFDSQTRTASALQVGQPIPLDHLGEANGVSVQNNTRLTVAAAGTYNVQFSCELHNQGGGGPGTTVTIWLVKNGIALADTSTKINVNTNSPYVVPAWNFVLTLAANDYVELYWSTDNLNIVIEATGATGVQGATGFSPSIPSSIVTVQQIAYAITGATGVQGASGIQGASGVNGASGTIGVNGASGIQGASGSTGLTGATGSIGTNGASGIQGASGSTGLTGATGAAGTNGATGSAGTNGSTGVQGASGSTGLTGATGNSVAASYLKYTRSAAQTTGLTAGSRVICNVSESTAGSDITIDTSTGAITLAAGKTYRLRGAVPNWAGVSNTARPSFCWYNEATSAYIGEGSFQYSPGDGASYGSGAGMSEAIITTSSSTIVSFRILAVGAALTQLGASADFNTTGSYPWVDVEVISGNSPLLSGATGATGIQGASGSTGLTGATGPAPSVGTINWAQTLGASGFSGATGATGVVFSAASFTGLGNPIEVTVCGDANPLAAGGWCRLQLYRDSTPIGTPIQAESSNANENIPYAFHVIDNPGAGTFTYALRCTASAGSGFQFGEAGTSTITVKELSNVRGATGPTGATGVQGASGATGTQGASGSPAVAGSASFGEMTITNNSTAVTCTNQTQYYLTTQWAAGDLNGFSFSSNQLVANVSTSFFMNASLSFKSDKANQLIQFAMYKNGSILAEHTVQIQVGNANAVFPASLSGVLSNVVPGDAFDIRVENLTSAGAGIIVVYGNFAMNALSGSGGATGPQGASGATGTQGASGPNVSIPAWTSAGAITIGGTTTAPTKATTRVQDNISYRQVGAKQWEVIMTYFQTSATGAANGSGDYLFTLPNSLSFDTTLPSQIVYTSNVGSAIWAHTTYIIPSGKGMITNSATGGQLYPVVYNSTQFRILTTGPNIQFWGSGYYQMADNNYISIQLTFRFTST